MGRSNVLLYTKAASVNSFANLLRYAHKNTEERPNHSLTQEPMRALPFVINYQNSTLLAGNARVRINFCSTVVRRHEVRQLRGEMSVTIFFTAYSFFSSKSPGITKLLHYAYF